MAWVCAACAGENPDGTRFCGHCGTPAAADVGSASAATATAARARAATREADVSETLRSFVADQVADRLVEAGGTLPNERRLITALFADVSGFTTLADRLDPEQLLEVIDPVIAALSSVVGRYEGYVEKFAGDALLALFGAPIAHEDDAQRALSVALEMHEELARTCERLGPHASGLTLHVGVNSGHGIARILGSEARMDYAVLGDSVIVAQRLESAAPPGETYVSELTHRLARDDFEFEPIGELTLKGKLEPVPAWRLVGRRRDRLAAAPAPLLVGRRRELDRVLRALEPLERGRGTVVTVTGEPGVGKSRLKDEVRRRATERGARWLDARCLSYGAALPYWPYADLLRTFAGVTVDDDDRQAAERLRAAVGESGDALPFFTRLLGLPPPPGADVDALEPEAFSRGLHDAFASWLRRLADEQPLVVALEDVHWADASSLELTADLARLSREASVALYLVARPEGADAVAAVREARGDDVASLELRPLDAAGVEQLVSGMLGAEPPRELVDAVTERAGGNPLFAGEIVRSLQERGDLAEDGGRWRMKAGWEPEAVPPTVEGLIGARIDLLPRPAASVLQTASVIGRQVPLQLLAEVAEDAGGVEASLERLVAATLLHRYTEDGTAGVAFHHALVQEVAYSRLLRRQRRELHRRVADVAEALYGAGDDVVALLARHLYLAEAGDKAVDYLVRAGARAKRLFANEEAIEHFARAAELAPGATDIRLELADLHELVGHYDEARRLYADVLRDAPHDVRAWRGVATTLRKQGRYDEALTHVNHAFRSDALRNADLAPLWLENAWTLTVAGRFDEAIDVAHAALEASSDRGETTGFLLTQLARAETMRGRTAEALTHALDARRIFEAEDDARGLATALRVAGNAYMVLGQSDEAADTLRLGLQVAERVGNVEEIGGCLINLGLVQLERGALDEAIECDRRAAAEFERIGHGSGRAAAMGNLAEKLARAGRLDEALAESERALTLAETIGHLPTVADVKRTVGWIRLEQGEFSESAAAAEEAAERFLEMGAAAEASDALELAAQAWRGAGEQARAEDARERARAASAR